MRSRRPTQCGSARGQTGGNYIYSIKDSINTLKLILELILNFKKIDYLGKHRCNLRR